MSNFSHNVAAFAQATNSTLDEACRAIKLNLFSGVIMATRVDTGRLRGNWQTSIGQPKMDEIDRLDPNGTLARAEAAETIRGDTVDYLTNNLPYAEVWEEQDGMIESNMARIDRTLREVANNVS